MNPAKPKKATGRTRAKIWSFQSRHGLDSVIGAHAISATEHVSGETSARYVVLDINRGHDFQINIDMSLTSAEELRRQLDEAIAKAKTNVKCDRKNCWECERHIQQHGESTP